MRFVDTNVLIYAWSADPEEQAKASIARHVIAGDLGLSAQVLQEFFSQMTRASRRYRLSHIEARDAVLTLSRFPVAPITLDVVRAAIDLSARWSLSYWDAAIIEAARSLRCDVVLTEDLADGEDYEGVRIENPFRGLP